MNGFSQALGAIYVALATASGGESGLQRANKSLTDAVNSGAVNDPDARIAITSLVRACSRRKCDA